MTLPEMLVDLPKACDIGSKVNAKGYLVSWKGYKFHIDTADGQIPISCILTSASVHDSQVALPLTSMSKDRVRNNFPFLRKLCALDLNAPEGEKAQEYLQSFELFQLRSV